ncbi:sacsin N-terminal ATP-binding-like domain-containing protein [Streptomyces sp. 4N509B]|uniref:sacsin N-terminal ATP-binding-like domain-containing protein n=1 Tax=Streptomyces sp. 4N509B TaxID=3457413 RepID=UPI003FD211A9
MLSAWRASPARFREDANAEEDLARGGYRDRLVIELAQNAADAAARAGQPGRLLLSLDDGVLVAANTGAVLDEAGVESLSTLRASAKRDDTGRPGPAGAGAEGAAAPAAVGSGEAPPGDAVPAGATSADAAPDSPAEADAGTGGGAGAGAGAALGPGVDAGSVGRFGIGFAAVLAVSDEPAVVSRSGGVRWSLAEATELAQAAGAESPRLRPELERRSGQRHAVPLLRLPLPHRAPPVGSPGAIPEGYDTAVVLPLRDAAAEDLATRLRDAVDDTPLLTLPALTEVTVVTPGAGARTLTRRQFGPYTQITAEPGPAGSAVRSTRWRVSAAAGDLDPALLADRPLEERDRRHWSLTWAVPVDAEGAPAPPHSQPVVHAPTPTDDALGLPALLIASFPLEPTRRRVAPGPLTDFLLDRAADAYAALLADWRPVTSETLNLVPGPLGRGELDGALRERLLDRLPTTAFLPSAAAALPADASDVPEVLRPADAELVERAGAETVAVLAELFPVLLPAGLERRAELRMLGVTRVSLGEIIDRLAGVERPPSWWWRLYDSLAGVDPDLLTGLPVPLAGGWGAGGALGGLGGFGGLGTGVAAGDAAGEDAAVESPRTTIGPRRVLLPVAGEDSGSVTVTGTGSGAGAGPVTGPVGVDYATLGRLGLKVAHPEAAHPLLEKLGASPATPRAVLDTPQVRAAVAASADIADAEVWDEDAMPAAELAETVLALVRDAGLGPGDEPWLAALALPDEDGELTPAGELVFPGSPFQRVIRDGELAACDPELAERWGEQPLTAVGVQADFVLIRATDVVLDPDELEPTEGAGFAEPDDVTLLDAVDVWCEDLLDALPDAPLPPVATEVLAVRDLELVDDERWPEVLALLSRTPFRQALTVPVRIRMPDGGLELARPYAAWWLRGAPVLDGRRPVGLRAAGVDPLLAGLYEDADAAEADEEVLRALGVRTTARALLAEPGGAAELLARLADPERDVTPAQLHGLYGLLARLDPEEVTLPEALRAVVDGEARVVPADSALVADAPDLLPLAAGRPLLPAPPELARDLAAVLDVGLLSAALPAPAPEGGVRREVHEAARALLGEGAAETYVEHEELLIDGTELEWRVAPDGTLHAATVEGLAAALAWAAGQWPRRFELAALLEDPSRADELENARWFD